MINSSVPVLVVDDVASMRNILSLMLNRLGFETVVTADDARQAIQKLEQGEFGLVISDWQMDGMTGLELLNKNSRNSGAAAHSDNLGLGPIKRTKFSGRKEARAHRDISLNHSGSRF